MTNGEKIKEIFPTLEISPDPYSPSVDICIGGIMLMRVDRNWWNAEYKEPTTKNDLGVDKLISDCEKMSFDMEIFNKPLKVVALDAVKNIVKDMPSVTPQEPKWIPVSERLPDTEDEVLCWHECYHWSQKKVLPEYSLGRYSKETSGWFGEVANGKDVRVIAWMPLPTSYQGEKNE